MLNIIALSSSMLSIIMLSIIMLSIIMLSIIMLSIIILLVIFLSVIILMVTAQSPGLGTLPFLTILAAGDGDDCVDDDVDVEDVDAFFIATFSETSSKIDVLAIK